MGSARTTTKLWSVDVKVKTDTTVDKIRSIWAVKSTSPKLKMCTYTTGVCSRLTYGADVWILDAHTCVMLNGSNSRMVVKITGKSPHEETSAVTHTLDVVGWIQVSRLQWVGHILRMDPDPSSPQLVQRIGWKVTCFQTFHKIKLG